MRGLCEVGPGLERGRGHAPQVASRIVTGLTTAKEDMTATGGMSETTVGMMIEETIDTRVIDGGAAAGAESAMEMRSAGVGIDQLVDSHYLSCSCTV